MKRQTSRFRLPPGLAGGNAALPATLLPAPRNPLVSAALSEQFEEVLHDRFLSMVLGGAGGGYRHIPAGASNTTTGASFVSTATALPGKPARHLAATLLNWSGMFVT